MPYKYGRPRRPPTIHNPVFQIVTLKICNLVLKLWRPMGKKVQYGTSGDTIYHLDTQFYHRVTQFFIGLCNFITRLQIPLVTI